MQARRHDMKPAKAAPTTAATTRVARRTTTAAMRLPGRRSSPQKARGNLAERRWNISSKTAPDQQVRTAHHE